MQLLLTWLFGVPIAILFLFNVLALDVADVFEPVSPPVASTARLAANDAANPAKPPSQRPVTASGQAQF